MTGKYDVLFWAIRCNNNIVCYTNYSNKCILIVRTCVERLFRISTKRFNTWMYLTCTVLKTKPTFLWTSGTYQLPRIVDILSNNFVHNARVHKYIYSTRKFPRPQVEMVIGIYHFLRAFYIFKKYVCVFLV